MIDLTYFIIAGVTLALSMGASFLVRAQVARARRVQTACGLTGAETAALLIRRSGLDHVTVTEHEGFLSDHYNPLTRTLALSREVYHGRDAAALGIAAHEAGHALQHAQGYFPMWVRSALVPVAGFGSALGPWLVMGGMMLGAAHQAVPGLGWWLAVIGLGLFGAAAAFTVVTLPVEFDASARARRLLAEYGLIREGEEAAAVRGVLTAAGLTYVAAAATSVLWLLYWAWQAGFIGGHSRD